MHRSCLKYCVYKTLVYGDEHPEKEGLVCQRPSLGELLVQLRVRHGDLGRDVLIEYKREDGQHRVHGGIADHEKTLVQGNGCEVEDRRENSLHRRYDQSPVHDKLRQSRRPLVRSPAVHQQQPNDVAELRD